ncbi:hypothetical protein J3R30DRAFT_3291546 [Lentinula aciculospora]|uniref:Jacalin-type lectin domain-containing protein n=1 Tax=Lentinula aciculospora TaxID=153920 RepID=A0A9W9A938_9AGAR|nr:hypothetical protein J3R30DRAFT_3291546 [Lentinula aciculospora]
MHTLKNFPKLPASVGGQSIPDFLKFKVRGPVKRQPVSDKFNFAITASPHFGTQEGSTFDEGRLWHPIHSLEFSSATGSDGGLMSFRGHYRARSTALAGKEASSKNGIILDKGEFIKGISGTADHYITSLTINTSKRDVNVVNGSGGKEFQFVVPDDHQVVAFHGTENGNRVASLGVLHQRRLETISDTSALSADDPAPVITASLSSQWLDATTQSAWANNDMSTVENLKIKASQDLLPIYTNIANNGDSAWTEVEGDDGEIYYLSWTNNGVIWSYTPTASNSVTKVAATDTTKAGTTTNTIISIGSYSTTSNFLGISLFNWSNVPTTVISAGIALGFAYLVRPIIQTGVEMGLAAAADLLAEGLAAAGMESAAVLVPSSVATVGGVVIAGVLGIALALGCIALASVIFKQYFLIINVYNFDIVHQWTTVQHYEDNSVVSNGGWQDQTITHFITQGNKVSPPGFNPVTTLDNNVTYLNVNFQNDSTFLQGLGEGIVLNRDDAAAALAIKYVVHRSSDNEIGAEGIDGNGTTYDLSGYYNNSGWTDSTSCQTTAGGMNVFCYTPALGGASNETYTYEVNLGLPPAS